MKSEISSQKIIQFQEKIFVWWEKNKRGFPWRKTADPYKILVSEIMLQQTQASRVSEKFIEFIRKYPNPQSLSEAQKTDLLSIWSGLGYNRRVLWLQEAAQKIIELEEFPKTPKELQKLKGIGKYSANSILIFAFNLDLATVDTNIRRILIAEGFADEDTTEKELFQIAEQVLPKGRSREWHNALMDYGAIHLTVSATGIRPNSKPSKFKGSDREKRGKILRYLLDNEEATIKELLDEVKCAQDLLDAILVKMEKDGLISKNGDIYHIE
ncbi:MAG: Fe-S cluster assembly protein HesB [Candidatus Heimdallarchaeota archaeon]|nr:Fe-S cluster assembly protein HesB [Candidatus Heimdallarchaeota archaeon]